MQQVWRFRLWGSGVLPTCQGTKVRVLDPGKLNTGPGPDFRDAKVRIGDHTWVGCIELHRRASDWHRHGHGTDRAYDNVVLHVVGEDDCRITRPDGSEILQIEMGMSGEFVNLFNRLLNGKGYVLPMCGSALDNVASIFKTDWITALAFERILRKAEDVEHLLKQESGDWYQAVYITLARGLGFGANADNMERMARSVPFRKLLRHSNDIDIVEAMLFGQAGLLRESEPADEHEADLIREYRFFAHKYQLRPIETPLWHMSSRSASNSPYRRIAVLAKLICQYGTDLANKLCEPRKIDDVKRFLNVELSEYWIRTRSFGHTASGRMSTLGKQSQDLLIINVLAPLVYCRGLQTGRTELLDFAIDLWQNTEGEKNGITYGFEKYGIKAKDAFTSQALIQLHKNYCERRRCLECRLGHQLLSGYVNVGTYN